MTLITYKKDKTIILKKKHHLTWGQNLITTADASL